MHTPGLPPSASASPELRVLELGAGSESLFERIYRVQMNTLKLLVVFIPVLYVAARYWQALYVAALGCVYLVGRLVYWRAYVAAPSQRGLGYVLSIGPVLILALAVLVPALLGRHAA